MRMNENEAVPSHEHGPGTIFNFKGGRPAGILGDRFKVVERNTLNGTGITSVRCVAVDRNGEPIPGAIEFHSSNAETIKLAD